MIDRFLHSPKLFELLDHITLISRDGGHPSVEAQKIEGTDLVRQVTSSMYPSLTQIGITQSNINNYEFADVFYASGIVQKEDLDSVVNLFNELIELYPNKDKLIDKVSVSSLVSDIGNTDSTLKFIAAGVLAGKFELIEPNFDASLVRALANTGQIHFKVK